MHYTTVRYLYIYQLKSIEAAQLWAEDC